MIASFSFPKTTTFHVTPPDRPRKGLKLSQFVGTSTGTKQDPRDCARIVLPSEWAKQDVANLMFFNDVYHHPQIDDPDYFRIEESEAVRRREIFLGEDLRLWVHRSGYISPASIGERVSFTCTKPPETPCNKIWHPQSWSCKTVSPERHSSVVVSGVVGPMWIVEPRGNSSNDSEPP